MNFQQMTILVRKKVLNGEAITEREVHDILNSFVGGKLNHPDTIPSEDSLAIFGKAILDNKDSPQFDILIRLLCLHPPSLFKARSLLKTANQKRLWTIAVSACGQIYPEYNSTFTMKHYALPRGTHLRVVHQNSRQATADGYLIGYISSTPSIVLMQMPFWKAIDVNGKPAHITTGHITPDGTVVLQIEDCVSPSKNVEICFQDKVHSGYTIKRAANTLYVVMSINGDLVHHVTPHRCFPIFMAQDIKSTLSAVPSPIWLHDWRLHIMGK